MPDDGAHAAGLQSVIKQTGWISTILAINYMGHQAEFRSPGAIAVAALLLLAVVPTACHAVDEGFPCVGVPAEDNPSFVALYRPCPPHHAIFGTDDAGGEHSQGPGRYVPLIAACCPLPRSDILTDEHLYSVSEDCPDGYVMTGTTASGCLDFCEVRCTRVNGDRYRLGVPVPSAYWSRTGSMVRGGFGGARKVALDEIPGAIRVGIMRRAISGGPPRAQAEWSDRWADDDGCIGIPFGSLLVGKRKKSCDGFIFRQLLTKDGRPVQMFPDCEQVTVDEETGKARCSTTGEAPKTQ